jgi:outer membrane receptor protein involved in Fe transport
VINIKHNIAWDISADWYFRYQDRYNAKDVFVSDISLRKSFSKFSLFIKATNLFDTEYLDFIGIPLPGRWISGGIKVIL